MNRAAASSAMFCSVMLRGGWSPPSYRAVMK